MLCAKALPATSCVTYKGLTKRSTSSLGSKRGTCAPRLMQRQQPKRDSETDDAKLPNGYTRASTSMTSPGMMVEMCPIILFLTIIRAERGKRFDLLGYKARQVH